MKSALIYSPDVLEPHDLRRIGTLAQRLLASDSIDLYVLGDAPASARAAADSITPRSIDLPALRVLTSRRPSEGPAVRVPLCAALARRTEIIQQTLTQLAPDVLIVDRLPLGRYDELGTVFKSHGSGRPPQRVLLLRGLLGTLEAASAPWTARGYVDAIEAHYDRVVVLGDEPLFDPADEHTTPHAGESKIETNVYLGENPARSDPRFVRRGLGVTHTQPLVLVRPGPGRGGEELVRSLIAGLARLPQRPRTHILCGDGMRESERLALACAAHALPEVSIQHSSRKVLSLIAAADVVVTNATHRSACEILTLRKRAVVVPSSHPSSGEAVRAARLAALGLVRVVAHPHEPGALVAAVLDELLAIPPRVALPPVTPPARHHAPARRPASQVHP